MENFSIIEEKKNPLFNRREIKFTIDAESTPSHADTRKIIAEKFSTPEENIRIKKILGKFGSKTFTISTNIYASEQDKLSTEGQSKKDAVAGDTPLQNPEEKSEAQKEEPAPKEEVPAETTPAQETPIKKPVEVPAPEAPKEAPTKQTKPKEKTE